MKQDHRQFRQRLRQNLIKAEQEASKELKRIEDLVAVSDQRDRKGNLTPEAHQARQARKNPFQHTTARSLARSNCEQKLKDAEHDAALAFQEVFICLEKVRYRAELLAAFDEPQAVDKPKAEISANEESAERNTFSLSTPEWFPPAVDQEQKFQEGLGPYEMNTRSGHSAILGPTHLLMFPPSGGAESFGVMAGLTASGCARLAQFGAPNRPVASLDGCDIALLINTMTSVAAGRLGQIDESRPHRHFTSHRALMVAAEELALWWLFHLYYRSNPRLAQLCPRGLFHNVEGPDWTAFFERPDEISHVRIIEPDMRSVELNTDPNMLGLLFDLGGLRRYGKLGR